MKSRVFRRTSLALLLLAALAALTFFVVPWKPVIEGRLKSLLEAQGFQNVRLDIAEIGFSKVALKDVSIGRPEPLVLKNLTVRYTLPGLLSGHLGEIVISGLNIEGLQTGEQWAVKGLTSGQEQPSDSSGFALPLDADAQIPVELARITESRAQLSAPSWQLTAPLDLTWKKKPQPSLTYKGEHLELKASPFEITADEATASLKLEKENRQWQGSWRIKNISIKGADAPLPPLQAEGDAVVNAESLTATGSLKSEDGSYAAQFRLEQHLNAPDKSRLTLQSATLPWNAGKLAVQNVVLRLAGKRDVSFPITVEQVSVAALLQSLTGKQATGTGVVSGSLPVTVKADGSVVIHDGNLRAEAPGKITLSPEAIPGDNEQIALVREILKDLHYKVLSIAVEKGADGQSSILMSLEGRNPAVYNGRPVKLNVRLTGDVLDLIQNSVMPLLNPGLLLKQDKHEKN